MSDDAYNYEHFTAAIMGGGEFDAFLDVLRAGDHAEDATVVDAATEAEVKLSSLWRTRHVVVEFGSMT